MAKKREMQSAETKMREQMSANALKSKLLLRVLREKYNPGGCVAVPGGLEPPTFGLGNRCSIRLSYGTTLISIAFFQERRFFAPFLLSCREALICG